MRRNFNSNSKTETEGCSATVVDPDMAWRNYKAGCSLRVLHPQRWSPLLAARLAALEQLFCSCVGCNAYLTPPGAKVGFLAAHFAACLEAQCPIMCHRDLTRRSCDKLYATAIRACMRNCQ